MKLTIVPDDKVAIVNGVALQGIDMAGVDPSIHVVQFDGTEGWIEYKDYAHDNEPINSIEQFQPIISRHAAALAEEEAKAADPYYGMSLEEKLEAIRWEKIAEINQAFQAAEQQPVTIGPYMYKGGLESGLAIDAQRRAMVEYAAVNPHAGITTVDFFDITGKLITLPLSSDTEIDALDVCLAIHQSASINAFKCAQLVAAARDATTIAEINAIHW